MSNRKRFLAMVLAVMMIVSTMAFAGTVSAAAPFNDVAATSTEFQQALTVLRDLQVVRGTVGPDEDGLFAFSGGRNVTRQEFALFVARLVTGTPEFFGPGAANRTTFTDISDDTFFAAINYCVEFGIITGRNDTTFDPRSDITLQEALAMLVRALGYTEANAANIPYESQRVLTHAALPNVKLIGRAVETTGFDFAGRSAQDKVTRNDMAMLLYNFLLSDIYEFGPVWDQTMNRWTNAVQFTPVLAAFGIEKITGYVTAIQNYATRLDLANYVESGNDITFTGTPITRRQANPTSSAQNAIEIEIMYADWVAPVYNTRGVETTAGRWATQRILTTFDNLGWDTPALIDQKDLLGLKVDVFRHSNVADSRRGTAIPASVIVGTRQLVNNAENKATAPERDIPGTQGQRVRPRQIEKVDFLTLGTGVAGATLDFDQRGLNNRGKDLNLTYNLYAFTNAGFLVSDSGDKFLSRNWTAATVELGSAAATADVGKTVVGRTFADDELGTGDRPEADRVAGAPNRFIANPATGEPRNSIPLSGSRLDIGELSIERELAKFVKAEGSHYELYFVDNGFDANGNREFFYVFIPYRAGRVENENPSWTGRADLGGENRYDRFANLLSGGDTDNAAVVHADAADLANLTRDDGFLFTRYGAYYKDVVIKEKLTQTLETVSSIVGTQVRFTRTAALPLNFTFATTGSLAVGGWQGSDTNNRVIGRQYRVYTDSNGKALMLSDERTDREFDAQGAWSYGFVTANHGSSWVNGRVVGVVTVFDADTGRASTILTNDVTDLVAGSFIAYRGTDSNEVLVIVTPNRDSFPTFDPPTNILRASSALRRNTDDNQRYGVYASTTEVAVSNVNSLIRSNNVIELGDAGLLADVANRVIDNTVSLTHGATAGTTVANRGLGVANGRAIINNSTRIIAYTSDNGGYAASFGRNNIPDLTSVAGKVAGIGFIVHAGRGDGNDAVRTAQYMFLYVEGAISSTEDITRYATIIGRGGGTILSSGFHTRYAQVYGTGEIIQVYADSADMLTSGHVVTIGNLEANGLYRASWIGSETGNAAAQADRLGSTLLAGSGRRNNREDNIAAIQNALYTDVGSTTAADELALRTAFQTAITTAPSTIVLVDDALTVAYGTDYNTNDSQAATAAAIVGRIRNLTSRLGLIQTDSEGNKVVDRNGLDILRDGIQAELDVIDATEALGDAFVAWFNAMVTGEEAEVVGTSVRRNHILTGATTNTYIGPVVGYVRGGTMTVGGGDWPGAQTLLNLTTDRISVRTIFVRELDGGTGFSAGNPASWTRNNARVAFNNEDEVWDLLWQGNDNDRVAPNRTWAVVTTDKEQNVLAVTFIVSGLAQTRDFWRDLRWNDIT